jgi:hypothetical protein
MLQNRLVLLLLAVAACQTPHAAARDAERWAQGHSAVVPDRAAHFTFPMPARAKWPLKHSAAPVTHRPVYNWSATWGVLGHGVSCGVWLVPNRADALVSLPQLVQCCKAVELSPATAGHYDVSVLRPASTVEAQARRGVVVLSVARGPVLDSLLRARPDSITLGSEHEGEQVDPVTVRVLYPQRAHGP